MKKLFVLATVAILASSLTYAIDNSDQNTNTNNTIINNSEVNVASFPVLKPEIYTGVGFKFNGCGCNGSGTPIVDNVFPGSPAEKAGLLSGDKVIAVDGRDVTSITGQDFRDLVVGKIGTNVTLTVERNGSVVELPMNRAEITIQRQYQQNKLTNRIELAVTNISYRFAEVAPNAAPVNQANLPTEFLVMPNSPNPFVDLTTITFGIPVAGNVEVSVFNANGQLVKVLAKDTFDAGYHNISWNGTNSSNAPVAGGVYFFNVSNEGKVLRHKTILMK